MNKIEEKYLTLDELYKINETDFYKMANDILNKNNLDTRKEKFVSSFLEETDNISEAYNKYLNKDLHVLLFKKDNYNILVRFLKRDYEDNYSYDILEHDFKYCTLEERKGNKKYSIYSHSFKDEEEVLTYSEELKVWLKIYSKIKKHLNSLNK